jgi:sugar phosphate isomerase/epimerase
MVEPLYAKLSMTVHNNAPDLSDLAEAAEALHGCGFWGIEPDIVDPTKIDADRLAKIVTCNRLRISALATGRGYRVDGLSLSDKNIEVREHAIDRIKAHIDLASRLDTNVIVGLLRGIDPENETTPSLTRLADSLALCGLYAARKGCRIFFEAINHNETNIANTAAETLAVIAACGSPSVQLLLDTYHLDLENESIYNVLKTNILVLGHFHLADRKRGIPGTAGIDFYNILKKLLSLGYNGAVNVEIPISPNIRTCVSEVMANLNRLGIYSIYQK